ncbi:DUF397 domain-containing protein [Streptomyces sp. MBT53]|uniref:DUF397 domain-containing protein n=1 Tax=Streptomyces sp. MBT53 TaxID=1488384 RepID=UPI0019130A59|nr:DUF397 domain-containing protein [Streptomyces sp. MBT53]MBK6017757.1 DUF397 domain-containing protein [Streptomyces sp. MBT53]
MTEVVSPFWKSSYSGAENNCIEVADTMDHGRAVRDSKHSESETAPLLTVSADSWRDFLQQF